jgi:hypothetical protein
MGGGEHMVNHQMMDDFEMRLFWFARSSKNSIQSLLSHQWRVVELFEDVLTDPKYDMTQSRAA